MIKHLVLPITLTASLLTPFSSQAYYYNEQVCGFSAGGTIAPGETFTAAVSVVANRTTDVNVPVSFYYSPSPSAGAGSTFLGSTTVFLPLSGDFCSSIKQVTLRMPTKSVGLDCFIPNQSYIIAKVGDDERAAAFTPKDGKDLPQISSMSPLEGRPGSLIHVKGDNIDTSSGTFNTGVMLNVTDLPTGKIGDDLFGVVTDNASSGAVSVKNIEHNYCVPPSSSGEQFTVLPAAQYCASGAMAEGFGRVSQVAFNGFNNDLSAATDCPSSNDFTGTYGFTEQGAASEALFLKMNACGAPAYDRLLKVYIDWNNDADFDDAGELMLSAPYVGVDTLYQLNMAVPSTAKAGTTRMRIISALYYSGYVDSVNDVSACGYYPYGETQDYSIDLVPSDFGMAAVMSDTGEVLNKDTMKALMSKQVTAKTKGGQLEGRTVINATAETGILLNTDGSEVTLKASGLRVN